MDHFATAVYLVALAAVFACIVHGAIRGLVALYHRFRRTHPYRDYARQVQYEDRLLWREYLKVTSENRCRCGKPGAVTITDRIIPVLGSVRPVERMCDDHVLIPAGVVWIDGQPQAEQGSGPCTLAGWDGREREGVVIDCECGEHVGMTTQQWRAGMRWHREQSSLSRAV